MPGKDVRLAVDHVGVGELARARSGGCTRERRCGPGRPTGSRRPGESSPGATCRSVGRSRRSQDFQRRNATLAILRGGATRISAGAALTQCSTLPRTARSGGRAVLRPARRCSECRRAGTPGCRSARSRPSRPTAAPRAPPRVEHGIAERLAGAAVDLYRSRENANAASSPTGQCVPRKFATPPDEQRFGDALHRSPRILNQRTGRARDMRGPRRRTRAASHALQNTSAGRWPMPSRSAPRSTSPARAEQATRTRIVRVEEGVPREMHHVVGCAGPSAARMRARLASRPCSTSSDDRLHRAAVRDAAPRLRPPRRAGPAVGSTTSSTRSRSPPRASSRQRATDSVSLVVAATQPAPSAG